MSEHDATDDALERLEWSDTKSRRVSRAAQITRRTALTGGAAGLAAALLEACGSAAGGHATAHGHPDAGPVASVFGVSGGYRFAFINHATTDTFFTPTVNGIQDACRLLNCSYSWTGSNSSNADQMVSAINAAVTAGVDGIATSLISPLLAEAVDAALRADIPVIAYSADVPSIKRLAYIGQNLKLSGQEMGAKIKELIPGGGEIAVFIAVPGSASLQPRLDGVRAALKRSNLRITAPATGAGEPEARATTDAFIAKHLGSYAGYFGVDGGSTEGLALAVQKYNLKGKVVAGGFDLTTAAENLLYDGTIQFVIDQQPYLQGFLATLELFLYRASDALTGVADVDTGLKFLYPQTVKPYATTKSRYEGTGTAVGVQKS